MLFSLTDIDFLFIIDLSIAKVRVFFEFEFKVKITYASLQIWAFRFVAKGPFYHAKETNFRIQESDSDWVF